MARILSIVLTASLAILLISSCLYANDPPHNETFGISCASCHGKVLTFYDNDSEDDYLTSPFWGGPTGIGVNQTLDDYPINRLCQTCHWTLSGYSDTNAPLAKTHSCYHYDAVDNDSEVWSRRCIDCHNPHQQEQKNYDANNNEMFLATGIIESYTYDSESGTSTLVYDPPTGQKPDGSPLEFDTWREGWSGYDGFANKTFQSRGAILLPDKKKSNYSYSIVSVNEHANQIVVRGNVGAGIYRYEDPTGRDIFTGCPPDDPVCEELEDPDDNNRYFGILYGQFIKQTINGKAVKFFDKTGPNSFADGDNVYDGPCQVCHTATAYFRNDSPAYWQGESAEPNDSMVSPCDDPAVSLRDPEYNAYFRKYYTDPWHANCSGESKAATNCGACHHHEKGFAHAYDSGMLNSGAACIDCHNTGMHIDHLSKGETCATCHDLDNMHNPDGSVIDPRTRVVGEKTPCDDCHYDGRNGPPNVTDYKDHWYDPEYQIGCDGCHNGRPVQLDPDHIDSHWQSVLNDSCVTRVGDNGPCWINDTLVMDTGGHHRLVGESGIRQYHCINCHDKTVDQEWNLLGKHTNGTVDVDINVRWAITGISDQAYYNASDGNCYNVYCHSDGTLVDPEVRPYPWYEGAKHCNSCHGHDNSSECAECHTGSDTKLYDNSFVYYSAMPMYENQGPDSDKANTHLQHVIGKNKGCDQCHADTVYGACTSCHLDDNDTPVVPAGVMQDSNHIKPAAHVNKLKNVKFLNDSNGTAYYDPDSRTCYNTLCHTTENPRWGGELAAQVCYDCHGSSSEDINDYGGANGQQARINLTQWYDRGHGRQNDSGVYDQSGNPAANFPINGCWYCHDPKVSHEDMPATNVFRLRRHPSFNSRFDKECVYCHMGGTDTECLGCHQDNESLAIQISELPEMYNDTVSRPDHGDPASIDGQSSCGVGGCHDDDASRHKSGSEKLWSEEEKNDVRNQYVMMGVCLICHDENSGGQCGGCHEEGGKYALGFDPGLEGTYRITPKVAKATSAHFGYKHYYDYEENGIWKGGKFCWDCHDPHGDTNIYMIHDKVTLESDGTYGMPAVVNDSTGERAQAEVEFTHNTTGGDYAGEDPGPFNKICNVCHSGTTGDGDAFVAAHYTQKSGDGHNISRPCTECHEHRFTDSHSGGASCDTCHAGKPVPRHSAFGLPRDCTKCHKGIRQRMDIMGQFYAYSHHVQNPDEYINNKHCYPCHWESTEEGLIDVRYHEGYSYKTNTGTKNDKVDLVVYGAGVRPTEYAVYNDSTGQGTATIFYANTMGTVAERDNVEQITPHCLSCHSDQNNETEPFNDCKTPNQYAWDGSSIDARYSDAGTTSWGKYGRVPYAAPKNFTKAFSAHGNAAASQGGFSPTTGLDGDLSGSNTRAGARNVQCFDCHSSHGSKVGGVTSSYLSFEGTSNGANLKETQMNTGGYIKDYKATANPNPLLVNAYNPGAGQCFDCHETKFSSFNSASKTPWGYNDTFGASAPIIGYKDNGHFSGSHKGIYQYKKDSGHTTMGSHFNAEDPPLVGVDGQSPPERSINGLCTPCHDPHGLSPTLGANKEYAVPLLKGTWLTSPYQEDKALPTASFIQGNRTNRGTTVGGIGIDEYLGNQGAWATDRNTFYGGYTEGGQIVEDDTQFAGLCLKCHPKDSLTDGVNKNTDWMSLDRVHESVKGWGGNHHYPCSKCHQAHSSGLPRLLATNCLDSNHRGQVVSGGVPLTSGRYSSYGYPHGKGTTIFGKCHVDKDAGENWNNINSRW